MQNKYCFKYFNSIFKSVYHINCNYVLKSGPIYVLQSLTNKYGIPVRFTASGSGDAADFYLGSCLHLLQVVIHLLEET